MDLKKAERMAKRLIRKHLHSRGLHGWEFTFDRARRRFGSCRFTRRRVGHRPSPTYVVCGDVISRSQTIGVISLSRLLTELNSEEEVREVILHEIAHALCGPGVGHSKTWRRMSRTIGCKEGRCYDPQKVKTPPRKYIAECPNCKDRRYYHQRNEISCGKCDNEKFNPEYQMVFRKNPEYLPARPQKSPSEGAPLS